MVAGFTGAHTAKASRISPYRLSELLGVLLIALDEEERGGLGSNELQPGSPPGQLEGPSDNMDTHNIMDIE